jgi:hypothetical protein
VQSSSTPSFKPTPVNLVQRKCACGGSAGFSGECGECQKKKLVGSNSSFLLSRASTSNSSLLPESNKAKPIHEEPGKPAKSGCPKNIDFDVKSRFIKKGAREILLGTNNTVIPSGDINAEATISAHVPGVAPKSAKSKAILRDWQVGFTQTMYQDFFVAQYDKSRVFASQIKEAGGPVIDVKKRQVPFSGIGGVPANQVEETPLPFITGDVPDATIPLLNPEDHKLCDPPDLLRLFFRELDATIFVIAFNEKENIVCPLEFIQWRQITDVKVSGVRHEPNAGGVTVKDAIFTPKSVDGVKLIGKGKGQGPRPPETTTKGGKVANDFQDILFLEDNTC